MKDTRKKAGSQAESVVAAFLESQGVRILQKNYRCRMGEIDLIGWDGECYIVVEVKLRNSYEQGFPAEAVGYYKQNRICRTYDYYRMKKRLDDYVSVRFDVVEVDWNGKCNWLKNAFEYVEA